MAQSFLGSRRTTIRLPSTRTTVIGSPASMNSPSETTSTRSPSRSAIPAGRSGDAATPRVPSHARSDSGADAKPARAVSSVSRTRRRPIGRRGRKRSRISDARDRQQERHRDTPDGAEDDRPCGAGADEAQPETPEKRSEAEDPRDPEAGRHEELDGEENDSCADQEQLLPADEPHQPVTPEEEREAADAHGPRHAEAGGPKLHDDPEDPDRHQERADHRMRQEAQDRLGPGRRGPADLSVGQSQPLEHGLDGVGAEVGELVLERFFGGERQKLALGDEPGNLHVGIDHGLGQKRRAPATLGGRAELLAHVGHGLLGHRLSRSAWLAHLDRGGGSDRAAVRHHDGRGGQADQGPGRDGALVHEGHALDPRAQERVADQHGGVHPSAEGIDLQDDRARLGLGGLVEDALDEGRQAQVDHALDRDHVDDRPRVLALRESREAGGGGKCQQRDGSCQHE